MNRTEEQLADATQLATEKTQEEDDRPHRKTPWLPSKEEMEAQLEKETQAEDVRAHKFIEDLEEEMVAKEQKAAMQLRRPEAFHVDFQISTGMIYMEDKEIKAKVADLVLAALKVHHEASHKRRLSVQFGEPPAL